MDGLVVGELPVRTLALPVAVPGVHLRQLVLRAVEPGAAAVPRATDEERNLVGGREIEGLADEVGGSVGAERDGGIAAGVVQPGARHGRIVRVLRHPGKEPVGQRARPRLPAVERGIHRAAVVVVPVVRAGDEVQRVLRVQGQRSLVLRKLVAADIDDRGGRERLRRLRQTQRWRGTGVARSAERHHDDKFPHE